MYFDIRQGDETLGVEIAEQRLVGRFIGPTAKKPLAPDLLVKAALETPVDAAPALVRAVVPGDRVTLALDSSLPALERLIAPIIEELIAGGVEPPDFSLLLTPDATEAQTVELRRAFPEADVA